MTKSDPAWSYYEIDASHSPNVTAPEALMALLQKIAAVERSETGSAAKGGSTTPHTRPIGLRHQPNKLGNRGRRRSRRAGS